MTKDPVCGMQIDETKSKLKTSLGGKTYYFCSGGCQSSFKMAPAKYAKAKKK